MNFNPENQEINIQSFSDEKFFDGVGRERTASHCSSKLRLGQSPSIDLDLRMRSSADLLPYQATFKASSQDIQCVEEIQDDGTQLYRMEIPFSEQGHLSLEFAQYHFQDRMVLRQNNWVFSGGIHAFPKSYKGFGTCTFLNTSYDELSYLIDRFCKACPHE